MVIQPLTGQSTQPNTNSNSGVVQPLTSKPTNNPGYIAPKQTIKQIKPPPQGFKIGDVINTAENIIGGVTKSVENIFKPINLPGGLQLNLINNAATNSLPVTKSASPKSNDFVQTTQQVKDLGIDPLNFKSDPKKAISDAWDSIKNSVTDEKKRIETFFTAKSTPAKVSTGLQTVTGAANVLFSPITALFNAANDVPVLGTATKLITLPFTVASEGAVTVSNRIINELPISNQAKDQIRPGINELSALVAQVALGKAISPEARGKLVDKFGVQDAMTLENKATEIAKSISNPLKMGENTPDQIINHVINNKLENTPEGTSLMKAAYHAFQQGKNISIDFSPDQKLINQYRATFPNQLLNTDNVRELYAPEGYNRINSAEFHDRASALSDQIFKENISNLKPGDNYLFTAGSSGAGKSTAMLGKIPPNIADGLDSNFSSPQSIVKLGEVIKTGANPKIAFVYRDPIDAWVNGVVKRSLNPDNGRVVPLDVFLKNLQGSKDRVLEAAQKYGDKVDIQVIDNSRGSGNAFVIDRPIDFLKNLNYNIEDVKQSIIQTTKDQIQQGTIPENIGKALLGNEYSKTIELQRQTGQTGQNAASNERIGVNTGREPQSSINTNTESTNKPSRIGKSIEAKAIENNLTKGFSETAGYTPLTIKDQAAKATNLVNNNIDQARAIIRGNLPLPDDLKGTALITAMEEHIKQNPSSDLAYELANSPLVSGTSQAAQELRLAAERTPDSATAKLAEIKAAREKVVPAKQVTATIKEIKSEITKSVSKTTKQSLADFIKELQCK